jgi:hypothetical protein
MTVARISISSTTFVKILNLRPLIEPLKLHMMTSNPLAASHPQSRRQLASLGP